MYRPTLHFILRHIVVCTCLLSNFNINQQFLKCTVAEPVQREVAMSSAVCCTYALLIGSA